MDACLNLPGDGQPPDVAADVSPTQMVEMMNSGIWISDKSGNPYAGYPESLTTFWQANSPPVTDSLTDTQVAWDPAAQRWLVTTLAETAAYDNGDLYFAFRKTSDATQGWNVYNLANICSDSQNGNFPAPDQPVLGFNQIAGIPSESWVAVDLQCKGAGGNGTGSDQAVLIPATVLTESPPPSTLSQTILTPPVIGTRPSRDISGDSNYPLYFAASEAPCSNSSSPCVALYTLYDSYGTYGLQLADESPANGAPGSYGLFTPAQHDSCGSGSACAADLGDARIENVVIQKGIDGNTYLLTSFHAGDTSSGTTQALWFVAQNPAATGFITKWNDWWVGGSGWWAGYPTITMDGYLGIAYTFQTFYYGSNIYPNWSIAKGFDPTETTNPPTLGYGILGNPNRCAYAGCPPKDTRWGDYISTIWDPNLPAPASSNGFWTAQEYSNGGGSQTGSNQATQITELANPLPYYVSQGGGEAECNVGDGGTCKLTLSTPPSLKNGDVVLVFLLIAGKYSKPPAPPDSTWTELPIADQGGATDMVVGSCATKDLLTTYAYAHVYGSSTEGGTYEFKHVVDYWCGTTQVGELAGSAFAYRGADTTAADYVVNAYAAAQPTGTITVGPAPNPSPSDGTLISVFQPLGFESGKPPADDSCGSVSGLTGSPLANWETLIGGQDFSAGCFAAADVGIPTSGTAMNQYSATSSIRGYHTFGWQVLLPPM
jgi:hypothetical protein